MALQWVSADLRTGRIIADLPSLSVDWPLRRTIGAYDTATAHLNLSGAPENWERATLEGGALLVCYDDSYPTLPIVWGGFVSVATRNSSNVIDLTLCTLEGYTDRRFVGDASYTAVGQNAIIADMFTRYVGDAEGVALTIVTDGAGTARDRAYFSVDNATVYGRTTQLAALQGGPEWTIALDWSDDGQSIIATAYIQSRIGTAKANGLPSANAVFELPGCVSDASEVRDYSTGRGANRVQAYSSGQGDSTPVSSSHDAVDLAGRPLFEYRWQPSSSIVDTSTLDQYARQALALLSPGSRAITLTASLVDAPPLGLDWHLGDDVGFKLGGIANDGSELVPAWPGGRTGVGRAIAYELTETTVTPILADSAVYTEQDS